MDSKLSRRVSPATVESFGVSFLQSFGFQSTRLKNHAKIMGIQHSKQTQRQPVPFQKVRTVMGFASGIIVLRIVQSIASFQRVPHLNSSEV